MGAYFAAKNDDGTAVPSLRRVVDAWVPAPMFAADGSFARRTQAEAETERAMYTVLDALIQMHASVAPEAIRGLMEEYPGQALTLFGQMEEPERRAFAESVYASRIQGADYWYGGSARQMLLLRRGFSNLSQQYTEGKLVHFAAALLARDPPPGFAASLLNETTVRLEVTVGGKAQHRVLAGPCGDGGVEAVPQGWPVKWTYVVEQSYQAVQRLSDEVLVHGNPPVTSRRGVVSSSCYAFQAFASSDRIALLGQMLGGPGLGWGLREFEDIPYEDDESYRATLTQAVARREAAYAATAAALVAKGLITEDEAKVAKPTLQIAVADLRGERSRALPEIRVTPGKTAFATGPGK